MQLNANRNGTYKDWLKLGKHEIKRESEGPLDRVHLLGNRPRFVVGQLLALDPFLPPLAIEVRERAVETGPFVIVRPDEGHRTGTLSSNHFLFRFTVFSLICSMVSPSSFCFGWKRVVLFFRQMASHLPFVKRNTSDLATEFHYCTF